MSGDMMMTMNGSSAKQHHCKNNSHGSSSSCNSRVLRQVFITGLVLICYATLQIFNSKKLNGNIGQQQQQQQKVTADKHIVVASDFSLAYEQSYGFFADIPNEDWKLRQVTARQHRHHLGNPLQNWNTNTSANLWYYSNYEPLFACPHVQRVGGPGDGSKWTCDPHRIPRVAKEEQLKRQQLQSQQIQGNNNTTEAPCLIYSIGSAGNYLWEDDLYRLLGPNVCEFHIFDPGHYDRPWKNAVRNMHYHRWGITSSYHPNSQSLTRDHHHAVINPTFMTFDESMRVLNHTNRTIEIFKVDCEYCEWFSYRDWIRHGNVRQLLIETHYLPMPETVQDAWPWAGTNMTPNQLFDDLQDANYMLFSKEPNIHNKNMGNLVEWSFIRLHPDFLHSNITS